MNSLRRPSAAERLVLSALLALCLGVRMLSPAGFMPANVHGSIAIVPCPDADGPTEAGMPNMAGMANIDMPDEASTPVHKHDGNGSFHQLCPYASAASLVGIEPDSPRWLAPVVPPSLQPLAAALAEFRAHVRRDRPPSQGPPLPV